MKKKIDFILLIAVVSTAIFGIIMIYSASYIWAEYKFSDPLKYVKMQSFFFIMGIIALYIIIYKIDIKILYNKANLILFGCLLLLVLVLIPGIGTVRNGSRSWFGIGPLGIQPSEFAKIGLIIFTAKYLSKNQNQLQKIIKGVLPILIIIGLTFLLIMLEPDFGTGVVLVMTLMAMFFVAGVPNNFFVSVAFIGLFGIIGLIIMAPYRLARIVSFINPWQDPLGSGFQIIQSLYAIGPGGLFGQGFLQSRQKHFYLPEPQTDFIFSIICEEFGVLGALLVVIGFGIIIYRSLLIAIKTNDSFFKYVVFGLSFGLLFQTLLNLMVVVGLIPVTGVTLPFLSYGGSSLLVSLASMGIILNISKNK